MVLSKLFDLTGRVALVTGGSKGLGKAMATGFAEAGADVVISSRHENELQSCRQGDPVGGDDAGRIRRRRHVGARRGRPARPGGHRDDEPRRHPGQQRRHATSPSRSTRSSDEDWDRLLELNLSSCMALTRALVPFMKERRWGRIIHISSIMGFSSAGGRNAYSATKSALLGLARASASDLGPFGITVNCIAPGPFLTDLPDEPAFQGEAG